MCKVLIFGGLTEFGSAVINHLLMDGDEVVAVRAEINDQMVPIEEDIELFFARNALFQAVDTDWTEELNQTDTVICLDSTYFVSTAKGQVDAETIGNRLAKCIEDCPNLSTIVIASHIDIYGEQAGVIDEKTPVSPITDRGRHVDQVERCVIETLLNNKNKARTIRAFICRMPNIRLNDFSMPGESISLETAAKGIASLIHTQHSPGIEVIQLTSGREFMTSLGSVIYSHDKANNLINFSSFEMK